MTLDELKAAADQLSPEERQQLLEHMNHPTPNTPKRRSLLDLRGAAAHLYDGEDAQDYINRLRAEWDERP